MSAVSGFRTKISLLVIWVALGLAYVVQQTIVATLGQQSCSLYGAIFGHLHNFLFWGATSIFVSTVPKAPGVFISSSVVRIVPVVFIGHLSFNYLLYSISCRELTTTQAFLDYPLRFSFGWIFLQMFVYGAIVGLSAVGVLDVFKRRRSDRATATAPAPVYLQEFVLKEKGRMVAVPVSGVHDITAQDYYASINTPVGRHLYRASLSSLEKCLDPSSFIRIHRSTIIALSSVDGVRYHTSEQSWIVTTKNGKQFRVSRRQKDALLRRLGWNNS